MGLGLGRLRGVGFVIGEAYENRVAIRCDILTFAGRTRRSDALHVFAFLMLGHGLSARGNSSLLSLDCRLSSGSFPFLRLRGPLASRLQFSFLTCLFRCGHTHRAHGHSFRVVPTSSLGRKICAPASFL
jgi:hypothetical protein